jgi:hypothetical protein
LLKLYILSCFNSTLFFFYISQFNLMTCITSYRFGLYISFFTLREGIALPLSKGFQFFLCFRNNYAVVYSFNFVLVCWTSSIAKDEQWGWHGFFILTYAFFHQHKVNIGSTSLLWGKKRRVEVKINYIMIYCGNFSDSYIHLSVSFLRVQR